MEAVTGAFAVTVFWDEVIKRGPLGLTSHDWDALFPHFDPMTKQVFRRFYTSLSDQSKWILERTEAMRDDAERIALLGKTMRAAGLRSYTDEKGRIYVASGR
jgi:hypothetical protein